MNTNRRNFIKSSVVASVASIAFPYIGLGESKLKRSPNSLFTIEELRTWCEKNGFHYIEDDDIKTLYDKENKEVGKYIINPNAMFISGDIILQKDLIPIRRDLKSIHRRSFIHKQNTDVCYDWLKYLVIDYKIVYKQFYLYDIENTSLLNPSEYVYSTMRCAVSNHDDDNHISTKQERVRNSSNVYCIGDKCWYKPTIKKNILGSGREWYNISGFERV